MLPESGLKPVLLFQEFGRLTHLADVSQWEEIEGQPVYIRKDVDRSRLEQEWSGREKEIEREEGEETK